MQSLTLYRNMGVLESVEKRGFCGLIGHGVGYFGVMAR